jgi:hypothetical protein
VRIFSIDGLPRHGGLGLRQAQTVLRTLCVRAYFENRSENLELTAAVRCGAYQRKILERLCRYITRPALANDRVQCNAAGQVELKLKTPWRDGTTHQLMTPLEFMQRLAALVPRPRLHLIRFGGRITSLREMSVPPSIDILKSLFQLIA